jgi:hypothetical protein
LGLGKNWMLFGFERKGKEWKTTNYLTISIELGLGKQLEDIWF